MSLDALVHRIGLGERPPPDADGLRAVHRAFLTAVPYEDLAVQLGESAPLEPAALLARMSAGGRGGYCFEINTVLLMLLEDLGFSVTRHQAIVGRRAAFAAGEPTNHLALVVAVGGERFLADAGWGEGPLDPLPLVPGRHTAGPFSWTVQRDGDGWWIGQHAWGSSEGFRLADAPSPLRDFGPHHARLSTSPESSFVQTLVVQQPAEDRITTLRARTLSVDGPGRRERTVLADRDALGDTLSATFGIDPEALGAQRLDRLWAQACAQHAAHEATRPTPPSAAAGPT